jgi:hypothetical protein
MRADPDGSRYEYRGGYFITLPLTKEELALSGDSTRKSSQRRNIDGY